MFLIQILPSDYDKFPLVEEIVWPDQKHIRSIWNKYTMEWEQFAISLDTGDCWEEEDDA